MLCYVRRYMHMCRHTPSARAQRSALASNAPPRTLGNLNSDQTSAVQFHWLPSDRRLSWDPSASSSALGAPFRHYHLQQILQVSHDAHIQLDYFPWDLNAMQIILKSECRFLPASWLKQSWDADAGPEEPAIIVHGSRFYT